jgi:RNA polymerase sigma-70 factor (ECF subfamily)
MQRPGEAWPDQDDLIDLVREAQRGEPRAVDALLARLRPSFVRFFARRIALDDAEDAAQGALIRVSGALGRIDPERARSYVVTVAQNLLRSESRRRAREARRAAPVELAEAMAAPGTADGEADYRDLARAVDRASLATLPPDLHEILQARLSGLSPSEIASRWQVNPATIRTRLLRARAMLRPELGSYC